MKVGQRLFLAVLPAAIGVVLVAALAYWGEYGREAPGALVVVAAVAVLLSLIISWRNTRYVAERIERLAGSPGGQRAQGSSPETPSSSADRQTSAGGRPADELDAIEGVMDHLTSAVSTARDDGDRREQVAAGLAAEYAFLLDTVSDPIARQLDQVQLPLHVLLENRFGDLNENQEEMIDAAMRAATATDSDLRRVRRIREIDRSPPPNRSRDVTSVTSLVRSVMATAEARAKQQGLNITLDLRTDFARVIGDRYQIEEALMAVLSAAVDRAPAADDVIVSARCDDELLRLDVTYRGESSPTIEVALARRLVRMQGGTLADAGGFTRVELPIDRAVGSARGAPDA